MADPRTREALSRTVLLCRHQVLGTNEVSDDEVVEALLATRVAIVADAANLAAPACQTAVSVLTRLVMQYGCSVALVMPEVPALISEPRFQGSELTSLLRRVAEDGLPGPAVARTVSTKPGDVVFVMGDMTWDGDAAHAWRVSGDEWTGSISSPASRAPRWTAVWPIGGLTAAAIASAEPFKAAMRRLALRLPRPVALPEQLAATLNARATLGRGAAPQRVALAGLDAISGGAIVQAALDVLLRLPAASADTRVFEPDPFEISNANRYLISRLRDEGALKISGLEDASRPPAFKISGTAARFEEATLAELLPLRDHVIVGADNLQARWLAQKHAPGWLGIGATADLMAMVSDHTSATPCAGCAHPFDDGVRDVIPTISFASYWAGLLLATALVTRATGTGDAGLVHEVNALRLDSPTGFRSYPLRAAPECPLRCALSSTAV